MPILSRKLNLNSLLITVLLFSVVIFLFLLVNYFFFLETIVLTGVSRTPFGLDKLENLNLLILREDKIAKMLINKNIDIAKISVVKSFPSSIIISVKLRQPVAQIFQDNIYYLIDEQGVVFKSSVQWSDLPLLEALVNQVSTGDQFETKYQQSVFGALRWLKDLNINTSRVVIVNEDEIRFIGSEMTIVYTTLLDGDIFYTSLQAMLKAFRIEGKKPTYIDMRFDKPVVRF